MRAAGDDDLQWTAQDILGMAYWGLALGYAKLAVVRTVDRASNPEGGKHIKFEVEGD